MRLSKVGKPSWNKGLHCTDNTKNKIMLANKNRKEVICIETGEVYRSIKEASRKTNIDKKNISNCCKKIKYYNTAGGYHWQYYNEKGVAV